MSENTSPADWLRLDESPAASAQMIAWHAPLTAHALREATGGLVEDLRAHVAETRSIASQLETAATEWAGGLAKGLRDATDRLTSILDAHASRTAEATCSHTWPCPVHSPASSSPEPGAVEALARLIAGLVGGRKWVELSYSDFARAVLTAGYLSPADVERVIAAAKAEVLREVAHDIGRCAAAGWSAGQIATALDNRARAAGPERRTEPDERDELVTQERRDGLVNEARMEVKAAVEEWFSNVSLDDLFRTKGWS